MLQRNALPNQLSTMICPRRFNDAATQPEHWQSLARTGIVCQRFRGGPGFEEGQLLRRMRWLQRHAIQAAGRVAVTFRNGVIVPLLWNTNK